MNWSVFSLCHKSISENKFKSNGLIPLTEETSREHNIESVVCFVYSYTCLQWKKVNEAERNSKCRV